MLLSFKRVSALPSMAPLVVSTPTYWLDLPLAWAALLDGPTEEDYYTTGSSAALF